MKKYSLTLAIVSIAVTLVLSSSRDALAAAPVSHWPAEGNALDVMDGNNGVLENGAGFASGNIGQAFSLDGVNDRVRVPNNANLNPTGPFSIETWFKADPSQGSLFILVDKSHGFVDSTGWAIQGDGNTGDIGFVVGNGGGGSSNFAGAGTGLNLLDDKWHHYAGVFTGAQVQVYVNGVLKGSVAQATPPVPNSRDLYIGGAWGGGSPQRHFRGRIDEIIYHNTALTAAEIQANLLASSPISHWRGEGDYTDSADGNDGAPAGGVSFGTGFVGQGFSFDGSSGTVVVPDAANLDLTTEFTLEAWINPSSLQSDSARGGVISKSVAAVATTAINLASPITTRTYIVSSMPAANLGPPMLR